MTVQPRGVGADRVVVFRDMGSASLVVGPRDVGWAEVTVAPWDKEHEDQD